MYFGVLNIMTKQVKTGVQTAVGSNQKQDC